MGHTLPKEKKGVIGMKRSRFVYLVIIFALITFGTVLIWKTTSSIVVYRTFAVTWEVTEDIAGANVDTDNFYLGKTPVLGSTMRHIYLKNYLPYPAVVDVSLTGEIRPYVQQHDWKFVLLSEENRDINITAYANPELLGKNLTGTIIVLFRKLPGETVERRRV